MVKGAREAEIQIKLSRAALDRIAGPGESVRVNDRFTTGPLRRIEDTSGTLIYSVGVNGKDDHGRVDDWGIRIPKKK